MISDGFSQHHFRNRFRKFAVLRLACFASGEVAKVMPPSQYRCPGIDSTTSLPLRDFDGSSKYTRRVSSDHAVTTDNYVFFMFFLVVIKFCKVTAVSPTCQFPPSQCATSARARAIIHLVPLASAIAQVESCEPAEKAVEVEH